MEVHDIAWWHWCTPNTWLVSHIMPTLVFIATIRFMSTFCLGLLVATFEQDSIVVTPSFWLSGMTLFGNHSVPQELDSSPTLPTLVLLQHGWFVPTACLGLLVVKFEQVSQLPLPPKLAGSTWISIVAYLEAPFDISFDAWLATILMDNITPPQLFHLLYSVILSVTQPKLN